jgi:hypothetical protein
MKNFRTAYHDEFLVRTSPHFLEDVFHWVRPILRPSHRAGYEIVAGTPAELAAKLVAEIAATKDLVGRLGIKVD